MTKVNAIDADAKEIQTDIGVISFDYLVIALVLKLIILVTYKLKPIICL